LKGNLEHGFDLSLFRLLGSVRLLEDRMSTDGAGLRSVYASRGRQLGDAASEGNSIIRHVLAGGAFPSCLKKKDSASSNWPHT
jgi:hypothetical protein